MARPRWPVAATSRGVAQWLEPWVSPVSRRAARRAAVGGEGMSAARVRKRVRRGVGDAGCEWGDGAVAGGPAGEG